MIEKFDLRNGDILVLKNGEKREYQSIGNIIFILNAFYDDELNCKTNDDYSVVEIRRPRYDVIFKREKEKSLVKKRGIR